MSFRRVCVLMSLALLLVLQGCGGVKAPPGFPGTLPFSITVTDSGKPIEKVNVILVPTGNVEGAAWTASGFTNTSGVAVLQTVSGSFAKKGAPEGEYKVVLNKPIEIDPELLGPEPTDRFEQLAYEKKAIELRSKMTSEVPEIYSDGKTTPVTITVAKGTKSESIDVSQN